MSGGRTKSAVPARQPCGMYELIGEGTLGPGGGGGALTYIVYWQYRYTLKNKRVNQHLKGPRSDSVFIVLHLPYYPAGANSLKC